ncbi:hypothetical protein EV187_3406 [Agromyces ramosus]|uniref:Uncharacterized protein n=1 Tax=Agromyces ramosus TaxID=33879 RepID=A0A4V2EYM4_9MICO|nr:hypothetical protein [Agromyces ramosus]RZS63500.1 hypothetical protein EV187_3406 [Agromyces ramosus]
MPITTSPPRRHPRAFALVAGIACLIALASSGCASTAPSAPVAQPVAQPGDELDCRTEGTWMLPDAPPTPDSAIPVPGRVPDGFEPAAALRCTPLAPGAAGTAPVDDTPPGEPVARVERFEGDLAPLISALAEPDDPVPDGVVCTADLELVPPLWLEGVDGRLIPVHYPRDACGKTKPGVHDALEALQVTSVSEVAVAPRSE